MNSRERLRRCYWHEETDRPAVYVRTGFPADDPTYDRLRAYLHAHTELKLGWNSGQLETHVPTSRHNEPVSADFERVVTTLHTPAGDLRATYLASRKGLSGLHETFFIKSRDDAERYLSLGMPDYGGDLGTIADLERQVGDRGIVDIGLGFNPAGFVAELCGSETFAMLSLTDRDVLYALCRQRQQILMRRLDYLLARGVGPFFSMLGEEYIVPPLHGPKDFNEFNVAYDKPLIDRIHDAGGRIHVHSHGPIRLVFDGFLAMGADVLHPIEPPPMGDLTAAEAKARARGRMTLEGNLQIADLYERTPEQIRDATEQLIADAFDDHRGLIVCPSASPYIRGEGERSWPQFKAMIDSVIHWKAQ